MAGMIEGMIKQHMPNYGKELNVQETTVYKPEYSWNYEVDHISVCSTAKLKTDLARILHGYPRPTNRQICQ